MYITRTRDGQTPTFTGFSWFHLAVSMLAYRGAEINGFASHSDSYFLWELFVVFKHR